MNEYLKLYKCEIKGHIQVGKTILSVDDLLDHMFEYIDDKEGIHSFICATIDKIKNEREEREV